MERILKDIDKLSLNTQIVESKKTDPYEKMDYGLAHRVGVEKDTWRLLQGTEKQDLHFEPIILRKPDVANEEYNIKTPHFLNRMDNRIVNVSGFEYKAKDIPFFKHKTQKHI